MIRIRELVIVSVMTLAALACQPGPDLSRFEPLAEEILGAATRNDRNALLELVTDTVALQRVLLLARLEPELVRAGADRVHARDGWIRGDTAGANFRIPGAEVVQMTFVRHDGTWRLSYVTLPER